LSVDNGDEREAREKEARKKCGGKGLEKHRGGRVECKKKEQNHNPMKRKVIGKKEKHSPVKGSILLHERLAILNPWGKAKQKQGEEKKKIRGYVIFNQKRKKTIS